MGLRGQQGKELTAWSGGYRARATGDSMGRRGQRGTQGACTTEYSRVQQGRRRWRGTAEQRGLRCAAGDNVAARNAGCSRDSVYRMGPGGSKVPTAGKLREQPQSVGEVVKVSYHSPTAELLPHALVLSAQQEPIPIPTQYNVAVNTSTVVATLSTLVLILFRVCDSVQAFCWYTYPPA